MLLTDILRTEWNFKGFVMSDWGAVADRVKGVAAGLDLEMPGSGGVNDAKIVAAVKAGTLSEAVLDKAVIRILNIVFRAADEAAAPAPELDLKGDHTIAAKRRAIRAAAPATSTPSGWTARWKWPKAMAAG